MAVGWWRLVLVVVVVAVVMIESGTAQEEVGVEAETSQTKVAWPGGKLTVGGRMVEVVQLWYVQEGFDVTEATKRQCAMAACERTGLHVLVTEALEPEVGGAGGEGGGEGEGGGAPSNAKRGEDGGERGGERAREEAEELCAVLAALFGEPGAAEAPRGLQDVFGFQGHGDLHGCYQGAVVPRTHWLGGGAAEGSGRQHYWHVPQQQLGHYFLGQGALDGWFATVLRKYLQPQEGIGADHVLQHGRQVATHAAILLPRREGAAATVHWSSLAWPDEEGPRAAAQRKKREEERRAAGGGDDDSVVRCMLLAGRRELSGQGAHRELTTSAQVRCRGGGGAALAEGSGWERRCRLEAVEALEESFFLDPFEIHSRLALAASNTTASFLAEAPDLEAPTERARRHFLVTGGPFAAARAPAPAGSEAPSSAASSSSPSQSSSSTSSVLLSASWSLPLHLRYRQPSRTSGSGLFARATLPPPALFLLCDGTPDFPAVKAIVSKRNRMGRGISVDIPVGDLSHTFWVFWLTRALTASAALVIVVLIWVRRR